MDNLYVLHTQYNLILATGLAINQPFNSSDLILFCDFNLTEELKKKIYHVYKNVLILKGNYPKAELTKREKYKKISDDIKRIQEFVQIQYDEIFIVDDMCIQEMYALKCAYQYNKSITMSWIEDGSNAYFDIGVVSGGMGATRVRRTIRKYMFTFRYSLWGFYDLGPCMGTHKRLTNVYALFPGAVRREHRLQNKIRISKKEFIDGMNFIYKNTPVTFKDNSILIAIDKIDVYGEKAENVNAFLAEIVTKAKQAQRIVYYKYHPRETQCLPALSECIELNRSIAFESYLTNSTTGKLEIIGFKSTALQTAKKIGYETISYIKQLEPNNTKISEFYESIGIICK